MKRLRLNIGDTLVILQDRPDKKARSGVKRRRKYGDGEWDVIRVNKKSVTLQNWPTYERATIKVVR
jgi:hypothetical protein